MKTTYWLSFAGEYLTEAMAHKSKEAAVRAYREVAHGLARFDQRIEAYLAKRSVFVLGVYTGEHPAMDGGWDRLKFVRVASPAHGEVFLSDILQEGQQCAFHVQDIPVPDDKEDRWVLVSEVPDGEFILLDKVMPYRLAFLIKNFYERGQGASIRLRKVHTPAE